MQSNCAPQLTGAHGSGAQTAGPSGLIEICAQRRTKRVCTVCVQVQTPWSVFRGLSLLASHQPVPLGWTHTRHEHTTHSAHSCRLLAFFFFSLAFRSKCPLSCRFGPSCFGGVDLDHHWLAPSGIASALHDVRTFRKHARTRRRTPPLHAIHPSPPSRLAACPLLA